MIIPYSEIAIDFTGATPGSVALQDDVSAISFETLNHEHIFVVIGSGTLTGNYAINPSVGGSGTPLANQVVRFLYLGNANLDGNDLTIFGRNLTQEEAVTPGLFEFIYNGSWQSVGTTDTASQPTKYDGVTSTALTTGPQTVNVDPKKNKHTQRFTGTGALAGNIVIQPDATASPKDGDEIAFLYNGTFTPAGGFTITIAGIVLDDTQVTSGNTVIVVRYDLANTTWRVVYSSTWADVSIESITHSSLTTKIGAATLVAGKYYLLTDYWCIHNIDDGVGGTILNSDAGIPAAQRAIDLVWNPGSGSREPLLLRAISTNQLAPEAISTVFPQDEVIYNVSDAAVGATRGRITWRKNGTTNEEAPYDLRSVITIRWETEVGNAVYESAVEVTGAAFQYYFTFGNSRNGTTNGGNTIQTTQKASSFGLPHCYIDAASVDNKIGQGCFGITIIASKANKIGEASSKCTFNQSDYNELGANSTTWDLQSCDHCLFSPGFTGVRLDSFTGRSWISPHSDFNITLFITTTAYNGATTYSYGNFATSGGDTFMYINLLDGSGTAPPTATHWVKVYDSGTNGIIIPDQLKYAGRIELDSTNATETIAKLTLPAEMHTWIFGAKTNNAITWTSTARASAVPTDIVLDMDVDYVMVGFDGASDGIEFIGSSAGFAVEAQRRNYRSYRVHKGKGADVASANDLTLGNDGNYFDITGNTQINGIAIAGWREGDEIDLQFDSTPTVKHDTAAGAGFARCQLAGGVDFVATADDTLTLRFDGTYWREKCRAVI